MKRLLLILCFTPLFSQAQQNIGYVDVQEIFYAMPERLLAQRDLDAFVQSLYDELQTMEFNYEQKMKEYEQLDENSPATLRESLEQRIILIEDQLNAFQKTSDESVRQREEDLMKPIYDRIMLAVETVSKLKGFDHVFDVATALVFPAENEFTQAVMKHLGL